MKRGKIFDSFLMQIPEGQNVFETIFPPIIEAASGAEPNWIFEGLEHHVPNRKIGEIVRVMFVLMMDSVGFRSLNDKAEPMRSVDVPVVEVFRNGC